MKGNAALSEHLHDREMAILQRLAAGLSDQQIADDLCLSLHTVKWYNRQIYGKLGVKSRTQAIKCAQNLGVLHGGSAGAPLPVPRYQLPVQTAPFIGRSRELSEVRQLLSRSRLLTLTGTGGTGKTRLALQVAEASAATFADGVCFVDLAPLADHTLVMKAIAGALGVVEHGTESLLEILKRVLAQRDMLLLIDNFEQVITAAPLLSTLLAATSRLKVLVTSREPLHLAGEQEYPVPPLTLPRGDTTSVQSLADSEAGALFVRCAQMALPRFEATDANASTIRRICIHLDGLPLAIELAAARCKLLTPQALLARLEGKTDDAAFQALAGSSRDAPPRQRTLRDTIAWSYNLLSADEQRLFTRLAVFQGGCSLEAIEAVCAEGLSIDVFDGLASLVDKSLVQQKDGAGGEPRFALLKMIHAYARERLEASGEATMVRRRHVAYFVALAERAEPELRLSGYDHWCRVFELELDNIRAALEWSLQGSPVTEAYGVTLGVRLAAAIGMFWYGKGYHAEGFRWTQQLLARLGEAPVTYHPKFLISAGRLAWFQDLGTGQRLINRALDCSRELGDALQTAWALTFLSYTMMYEPGAAMPLAEEALAAFRRLHHLPGIAQTLNIIGEIARVNGDDTGAQQVYEECLAVCQQTGETGRISYMYSNLAFLAQHAGDTKRAVQLARNGLLLARDRHDRNDIADAIIAIAGSLDANITAHQDRLRHAAQLLGAAEAEHERMGTFLQPSNTPEYHRILVEVREHLDDPSFHAAWLEGRRMTLDQAITYALEAVGDEG
jgi:predicted ATPase/DNA-binding CsgD family transcriptional regulator